MRVLVLGVSGMLGSAVFKVFSQSTGFAVWGTARAQKTASFFDPLYAKGIISGVDVLDQDALPAILAKVRPHIVINCVGLVKQLADAKDPLVALPINSMLPHRLSTLCALVGARLIHISTDCVFSGKKGHYLESDPSDAEDLYGKSKFIGELHDDQNAITLRTSIIGHGLTANTSLVDWFLHQQDEAKGFTKAVFSGLPTVELAHVIRDYVIPNPDLSGLYHISAAAINKFDLLSLIAQTYNKNIKLIPDDNLKIDRSLNSERFTSVTGYMAPNWPDLVRIMFENRIKN